MRVSFDIGNFASNPLVKIARHIFLQDMQLRSPEKCDIYLAFTGACDLVANGFLVTEKSNFNRMIAYCPLPPGIGASDKRFSLELERQLRTALRIAQQPDSAELAVDAIWLGWPLDHPRPIPHWIFGLSCRPLTHPWDGRFMHPKPFCSNLFQTMAEQPSARAWLMLNAQAAQGERLKQK
jgi:hypothetical protein